MSKISIIVPTYNRSSYLVKTINSILSQDYKNIEIIVSDNASDDNTQSIMSNIVSKDSRVLYYRNEENIGINKNYNFALSKATGEFIHVFSDDDIMLPECLSVKMNIFKQYPKVGLIHSDIDRINSAGEITSATHWSKRFSPKWWTTEYINKPISGNKLFETLWKDGNVVCMPSVIIRAHIIKDNNIGFRDVIYYAIDWLMWFEVLVYTDTYFMSRKTIQYRSHETNNIKQFDVKKELKEILTIKRYLTEKYSEFLIDNALSYSKKSVLKELTKRRPEKNKVSKITIIKNYVKKRLRLK